MSSLLRAVSLSVFAAVAAVATGCGGSDTTTVERTVIERVGEDDGADAAEAPASEKSTPDDDPADELGDDEALPLNAFQSPSGNIGCVLSDGAARCDIARREWTPSRPAGCPEQSDFGQGLEVGRSGPGQVVCAGDTTLGAGTEVLPYGRAARSYGFTCFSRMAGITCADDATGHGFLISIQRYRLF